MSKLLDAFNREYQFLYESHRYVAGYDEAVAWFDENQSRTGVAEYRDALNQERQDFISSDREAAAFAFALEALDLA